MARTKGSSELFSLIHSLTPEEKGYYRKFSKRHNPQGSNYLKLFDAISKQTEFEEESLRKKFRNYTVMKVYLKELITDSLLLYHKNRHPHVNLFSQVQKIHILLIKGQYSEALRFLKKSLEQSRKMEVFTVERYLLRVLAEINHQHLTGPLMIKKFYEQYKSDTLQNWAKENDLTDWELMNIEWFARVRGQDPFDKPVSDIDIESVKLKPTISTRSEIKRLNCLNYVHYLRKDLHAKYEITLKQLALSEQYKLDGDASFNNVFISNNHMASSLDINKFKEAITIADEMAKNEAKWGFYYDLALPKSIFFKLDAYFHLGLFKEGLELIRKVNKEMVEIAGRVGDNTALREFYLDKLIFLFVNELYRECWIEMQSAKMKSLTETNVFDYADYCMLQLMLQFEMDNYQTIYNLVGKAETSFQKLKIEDITYQVLFSFFREVKLSNLKNSALKASALLKENYRKKDLPFRKAFGLLDYTNWLDSLVQERELKSILAQNTQSS